MDEKNKGILRYHLVETGFDYCVVYDLKLKEKREIKIDDLDYYLDIRM